MDFKYTPNQQVGPVKPKFATKIENGKLILNDGSIGSKTQTNKYTPNLYSDILAKVKEPVKTNIKLPTNTTTGPGTTTPTQINKPLLESIKKESETPQITTPTPATKIGTQVQASEGGDYLVELQTDIQKGIPLSEVSNLYPELGGDETLINQLYTDLKAGMPLSEIPNLYPELGQEKGQGFIGGVAEKTKEGFMGGIKRIGEAGVGLAEGKYNVGEAFVRGGAGALQSAFSPITGVVGETLQTGIEQIPEDIRTKIKQEARPTIEGVKEWYNSQSPEQKRRLNNIGVGVELLANFVGVKGAQKVAPKITPAFKSTGKTIVKGGKNIIKKTGEVKQSLKATKEQITSGLTKEQIKGFQSNPYQADEFTKLTKRLESPEGISDVKDYKVERVGAITKELTDEIDKIRATKGETSQVYKQVRQQPVQVKTDTLMNEFKQTLQDNGMTIKKGNIERVAGSKAKDLNQSDISKFNQLLSDIKADSKKGYLTPDEILTFRKTASDLAKYDASSTTTGQGIMKSLRKNIDNTAKEQIPGLKELDSQFVDKLDDFENAIKDLVYKGGDVKGEWRSNIVNIVGTLDRANRAKLLSRLDEVIPGIGERIQAIDNLPTILKSLESKGIFEKYTGVGGAIAGATALGSTLPVIGHIAGAIIGGTGGKLLESGLTGLRKVALTKVLNKVSPEGLKRMKEINTKIAKRQLLREEDKTFINSLKQQFKNEIDKSKDNNLKPVTTKSMNNMSSSNPDNTTSKKLIPLNKKIEELKKPNKINNKGFIELNPKLPKREDLVVLHNLGIEKLKKIKELGGMPGPSLAVTKKSIPFEDFGDITLVGDKDLIQSMKAKTYSADIYSPRVPTPTIMINRGNKVIPRISKETNIPEWKIESAIEDNDFLNRPDRYPELKPYYEELESITSKKLFKGITYSGNKTYKDYSLDNIIKDMFSKGTKGTEGSLYAGNLSQTLGKEAKPLSLKQIKEYKIDSNPKLDAKYQKLKDDWLKYASFDNGSIIDDYFRLNKSNDAILKDFKEYASTSSFTLDDIQNMKNILKEATNLTRNYLETKIERAVGLKEFKGVIAPEEQISELKQLLKGTGLENKIVGYKKGEIRNTKLDKFAKENGNIFFNIGGVLIGGYYLNEILK